jgi:hypothetical protein
MDIIDGRLLPEIIPDPERNDSAQPVQFLAYEFFIGHAVNTLFATL